MVRKCATQITCKAGQEVCWDSSQGCYCEWGEENMPLIPTLAAIGGALAPVIGSALAPVIGKLVSGKM